MDQQGAIGLGAEQGLEDAINLWINGMAHAVSLAGESLISKHCESVTTGMPS